MKIIIDTILIEGFVVVLSWFIFMYLVLILIHGILATFRNSV